MSRVKLLALIGVSLSVMVGWLFSSAGVSANADGYEKHTSDAPGGARQAVAAQERPNDFAAPNTDAGTTWTASADRQEVRILETKATPGTVEPIDVLTLNTTIYSDSERRDGLVIELTVKDSRGETVQTLRQRNIGVEPSDDMAVYWVWRIPQRLADGTYSVQTTVYGPDGVTVVDRQQRSDAFIVVHREVEDSGISPRI